MESDTDRSPPPAPKPLVAKNRLSRLPVLRKVSGSVPSSVPVSPLSPQSLLPAPSTAPSSKSPVPRGIPTIQKRSSSLRLHAPGGSSTVQQATTASTAKITPRRSLSTLHAPPPGSPGHSALKNRQSMSCISGESSLAPGPSLSRTPSLSSTPKGRRTSDIHGASVAPSLARRVSNNQLRQPAPVTDPHPSGSKVLPGTPLRSKKPGLRLSHGNTDASPTPQKRQSSANERSTPLTPRLAKRPVGGKPAGHAPPSPAASPARTPGAHKAASQSLRDTIAKARAAQKTKSVESISAGLDGFDFGTEDPFNQFGGGGTKVILARIKQARFEGKLNLSAMQLKEIPPEVYKMYESTEDDLDDNGDEPKWYESVDLTRILLADNEITELGDELAQHFGAVASIDLHNNLLSSLPGNFSTLTELTVLNLTNNKLDNSALDVIFRIPTLTDLKLAKNNLSGPLPSSIGELGALESLELQENQITTLPASLGSLPRLRLLNASKNALSTIPVDALTRCPIQELDISGNKLTEPLFSATATWDSIQSINASNNRLPAFSSSDSPIAFPELKQLFLSSNALTAIPSLAGAPELLILLVDQNRIEGLHDEVFTLHRLRTLDISGNDIKTLDPRIGAMENLEAIKFDGNPLRDRQLAGMSSVDLKKTLRQRLAPPEIIVDTGDAATDEPTDSDNLPLPGDPVDGASDSRGLATRHGLLELTRLELTDLTEEFLSSIPGGTPTSLVLSHFPLPHLPPSLISLTSLTSLHISHLPLSESYIPPNLHLPNLQTLTITSCALTSLDPMLSLSAPLLASLDVSQNALTEFPKLRDTFPALVSFLARENKIREIVVENVRGLRVLDLRANEVECLPPGLGRLGGDNGDGEQLRELRVQGNRFRVPRWQVVERGTEAVLEWCRGRLPVEEVEGEGGMGMGEEEL
ncbi:L domain-like protein [Ascodesmis nigricans]|uniref:L domain-like protein n=1 Tax=Ascodesmis nigricans TaxID=341454 RepID=A0A4S2N071_9PEZI|nr:L domain-like protein [Ascodesmis nigricans]